MNKPIGQHPTQRPGQAESQSKNPGSSGAQPFAKTDPKPVVKDDSRQAPAKGARQEQPNQAKDPGKTPLRAAQGDDDLMSQGPQQS